MPKALKTTKNKPSSEEVPKAKKAKNPKGKSKGKPKGHNDNEGADGEQNSNSGLVLSEVIIETCKSKGKPKDQDDEAESGKQKHSFGFISQRLFNDDREDCEHDDDPD